MAQWLQLAVGGQVFEPRAGGSSPGGGRRTPLVAAAEALAEVAEVAVAVVAAAALAETHMRPAMEPPSNNKDKRLRKARALRCNGASKQQQR